MTNPAFPLLAPLVGAFHRPPAKQLLAALMQGTKLELIPEPTNPYDSKAVQVWVDPKLVPEDVRGDLEAGLFGTGWDLDELMEEPLVQLGFLAASGGKPLAREQAKQPGLVGNADWLAAGELVATLAFGLDGSPLVKGEAAGDGQEG